MKELNAYLNFNGNCREAMNFYKDCLGGELSLQTVEESPISSKMAAELQKEILHSELRVGSIVIMASDCVGQPGFTKGNNVSLCLHCSSEDELLKLFSKFLPGGNIICEVQDMFWGSKFGALSDKFGVNWLFNFDKNHQQDKVAQSKTGRSGVAIVLQ